ncbi:Alpha/Beta hydrolase protein [Jimgerdemannia flammicorona]|uniref:Alpha/Beta hydrolase protein n=1 Tax=Jimgerdemannia flammicorona TaxID=994334 RepID=A0A433QN65_9FUNG|nr:Alpha/Beta hydrolase protein [Jimgerdemannia flammicorona]
MTRLKLPAVLLLILHVAIAVPFERRNRRNSHRKPGSGDVPGLPKGTPQVHGLATNWTITAHPNSRVLVTSGVSVPGSVVSTLQYYARLASVAYCGVGSPGSQLTCGSYCSFFPNTTVVTTFNTAKTTTIGFVARDDRNRAIIIAYHGSSYLTQFIQDAKFFKVDYPPANGTKIHKGFFECFQDSHSSVYDTVVNQVKQYPDYKLVLAGHSLGGALAVLQAMDFYQNEGYDNSKMIVYTYGQPRIGNDAFSSYVDSLGLSIYRVINQNDIIPHYPPSPFNYKHHGTEYWIDDDQGDVVVCTIDEDKTCADSVVPRTSIPAHTLYWEQHPSLLSNALIQFLLFTDSIKLGSSTCNSSSARISQ